jgi:hypothetical protein
MGKVIAVLVGLLTVWGALAQIMPGVFQIRSESKLMPFVWGKKSIWIAVMFVGCLLGSYIWNLEGRLGVLSSTLTTASNITSQDETGLNFVAWASPDNVSCSAVIDASKFPNAFRDKFEIVLICGFVDPLVDQLKDTRISASQLFTPQNVVSIAVPFSKIMAEALAKDRQNFLDKIQPPPPHGTIIPVVNSIWMRIALLPKGFDVTNIHKLSDITSNGGKISNSAAVISTITQLKVS